MKLVVGLGNPGSDYSDTYHNVGFMAVDKLASRFLSPDFVLDKKSNALLSDQILFGQKTLLVKPQTYMNLSGDAVSYLARYYKIESRDILVIYDDIEMNKGVVRARKSGSAGTHNGMRDIVNKLGSTEFARVRIGIGKKPDFMELKDYVLSHLRSFDKSIFQDAFSVACDFAEKWLKGDEWQELTVDCRRLADEHA
ncbi:MAG: aminoacyl-tRNA hydrolase [Clostridiales bacterium]|nr:aminoacyl-tRNA hydrolase [Clostridiales bacterium]